MLLMHMTVHAHLGSPSRSSHNQDPPGAPPSLESHTRVSRSHPAAVAQHSPVRIRVRVRIRMGEGVSRARVRVNEG